MKLGTDGFVFIASLPLVTLFACSGGDRGSLPDGAVAAGAEPAKTGKPDTSNSECARFCAMAFGAKTPAASACTAQASHQTGLCYDCGPKATGGKTLCGQTCVSLQTDANHCGGCNTACTAPQNATPTCSAGTCGVVCDVGFADCDGDPSNGCEANLQGDANNCGTCGNTCPGDKPACKGGACGCAPPPRRLVPLFVQRLQPDRRHRHLRMLLHPGSRELRGPTADRRVHLRPRHHRHRELQYQPHVRRLRVSCDPRGSPLPAW